MFDQKIKPFNEQDLKEAYTVMEAYDWMDTVLLRYALEKGHISDELYNRIWDLRDEIISCLSMKAGT